MTTRLDLPCLIAITLFIVSTQMPEGGAPPGATIPIASRLN